MNYKIETGLSMKCPRCLARGQERYLLAIANQERCLTCGYEAIQQTQSQIRRHTKERIK